MSVPAPRVLAGVDIGTLTCQLLIARVDEAGRLHELQAERRILRLGQGVDQTRRLQPEAIVRVLTTLAEWRNLIERYYVDGVTVVATSAVRDAVNRDEFLDRVKRETGFEVEVITGDEEARRTLLGIRAGLPQGVSDILALDIGGGSTELILDRPGPPPMTRSLDIGVVRLCERVLRHDPPSSEEIEQARTWVRRETVGAVAGMDGLGSAMFIGTSGTVTSLAAMAQRLPMYEPARIHNYRLELSTVRELEELLLSRAKADRAGIPGLEKSREEVIAAGTIILRTIMEAVGKTSVLVSDLGLREGVLLNLATKMNQVSRGRAPLPTIIGSR